MIYQLALKLQRTVGELEEMSSSEFAGWVEFLKPRDSTGGLDLRDDSGAQQVIRAAMGVREGGRAK